MYSNQYEANFGILEKRQKRRRRLFMVIVFLIVTSIFAYFYFEKRARNAPEKIVDLTSKSRIPSDWVCKHTLQGYKYVTDDRGYLCSRYQLDVFEKGCCSLNGSVVPVQYSCRNCGRFSSNYCCTQYEVCVSCCLDPTNVELTNQFAKQFVQQPTAVSKSERGKKLDISLIEDRFDLCTYICRTSSSSIANQNSYKNETFKYCYGMSI